MVINKICVYTEIQAKRRISITRQKLVEEEISTFARVK